MKYIHILITLIAVGTILMFIPNHSLALEEFHKEESNPLPVVTHFLDWTQHGIYQPHVVYENGIYKLWYGSAGDSSFNIAYATSTDGLHWQSDTLLRFEDNSSNYNPFMFRDNTTRILFMSTDIPGSRSVIRASTSPAVAQTVLSPTESWESNGLFGPFVMKEQDKYYMFYSAWGSSGFQIGMAVSNDASSWAKCANNPLFIEDVADSPFVYKRNNIFYLFYHSSDGIRMRESSDQPSCTMHWSSNTTVLTRGPGQYDSSLMIAPSLLEKDNALYLYYSGLGSNGWTLNLATTQPVLKTEKLPVIFVPGLFASWNKDAIVYQHTVSPDSWVLNPMIHEYDGLIGTMTNLGYLPNHDFYVFNYDWRKSIDSITSDLDTYIHTKILPDHPDMPFFLIGHSLGGLLSRVYVQKYQPPQLKQLITVGSPHMGSALSYKAVEAGELETQNNSEWLMQKMIIQLYRDGIKSDKQIVAEKLPILKDLLPTTSFLTTQQGVTMPVEGMSVRNIFLVDYNAHIAGIEQRLAMISGKGVSTINGYHVKPPGLYEQLLDIYKDGVPIDRRYDDGDGIVTSRSSSPLPNTTYIDGNHGEIIYTKSSLEKLLTLLHITNFDGKIVEGKGTVASPSLLFLVMSPAVLQVEYKGTVYDEHDGLILVENAKDGVYTLRAKGTGQGAYTVLVGQYVDSGVVWSRISGIMTHIPADTQTDTYTLTFNSKNPLGNPIDGTAPLDVLENISKQLQELKSVLKSQSIKQAVDKIEKIKRYYNQSEQVKMRNELEQLNLVLLKEIDNRSAEDRAKLFAIIPQLEAFYKDMSGEYSQDKRKKLEQTLDRYSHKFDDLKKNIVKDLKRHPITVQQKQLLKEIGERFELLKKYKANNNSWNPELYLSTLKSLLQIRESEKDD